MADRMCITLCPERIQLNGSCMIISDSHHGKYRIPYSKIVYAVLRISDRESGAYYEPEIADIRRDMEGDIILYDTENRRWKILMDNTEKSAGNVMADLAVHAPYILIGGQTWLDFNDEEEFAEAVRMAGIMRRC